MAVSPLHIMAIQYVIHLIKGIIFLYLLMYVILEIDMNFKIRIPKKFYSIFQSSISQLILYLVISGLV